MAQRVEVKTILESDKDGKFSFLICKGSDRRCYTRSDCDIIALASLSEEKVLFFPVESFTTTKSITLTKNDFLNPSEKNQWAEVLDYSQKMMGELLYKKK